MNSFRRRFVSYLPAAGILALARPGTLHAHARDYHHLARDIVELFETLPGTRGLHIFSPGRPRNFEVMLNPDRTLFCGSAFKVFVLLEFLRKVEAGQASVGELLDVDSSVWSLSSPVLTPLPGTVTGRINARTAMDAMISRSDNTATDILLNRVGSDDVRKFLTSIGSGARLPDTTRRFFGYILGEPGWQTISWERLLFLIERIETPIHPLNPVLNPVQTMAASPRDFVAFYSRALQGSFFSKPATLTTFRSVLAQSEALPLIMPLGVNGFMKGGSIDFNGEHALCLAGGAFIPSDRWVHFAMMLNWTDKEAGDVPVVAPQVAAAALQIFTWLVESLASH